MDETLSKLLRLLSALSGRRPVEAVKDSGLNPQLRYEADKTCETNGDSTIRWRGISRRNLSHPFASTCSGKSANLPAEGFQHQKDQEHDPYPRNHGNTSFQYQPASLESPKIYDVLSPCQSLGPEIRKSFVLLCVGVAHTLRLVQLSTVKEATTDRTFFTELRKEFKSTRSRFYPFVQLFIRVEFEYVKFSVLRSGETLKIRIIKAPDFPPSSERDRYDPCGRSREIYSPSHLQFFFSNPSCAQGDSSTIIQRIPKKLDTALEPLQGTKYVAWGIHVQESINWRSVAIFTVLSLFPLFFISIWARQYAIIGGSIFSLIWIVALSVRDLVDLTHQRLGKALFKDSGHTGGSRQDYSSGQDVEKQLPKDPEKDEVSQRPQFRSLSRIFSNIIHRKENQNAEDKKDDGDDDPEEDGDDDPKDDQEALILDGFIQVCVPDERGSLDKLLQPAASSFQKDADFLKWLNGMRLRRNLLSWTGLMLRTGLWRVMGIHYCKIELFPDGRIQILEDPSYPPDRMSSSYQPTERHIEGSIDRQSSNFPRLNSHVLVEMLQNPENPPSFKDPREVMKRVIRKIDGMLIYGNSPCEGYAIVVKEGPDLFRIAIWRILLVLLSIVVGVIYAKSMSDVQSGLAIATCAAMFIMAFLYAVETSGAHKNAQHRE